MPNPRCIFVTGANRGIGLELVRQYAGDGWEVIASCRAPERASALHELAKGNSQIEIHALDVSQTDRIDSLATSLCDRAIDVVVNNAGLYGRKRLPISQVDESEWLSVFSVNTIAPFLVSRAFLPQLAKGREKKIVMIGSKVGSVAENTSGGNFAYRTSKAALNQVVKTLSIDLADRGIRVVALHPGWVKTEMGGPNALISTSQSVSGMRDRIAELSVEQSGRFIAFDGSDIAW